MKHLKHHETLLKHCETLKHSSFDATISGLNVGTSARRFRRSLEVSGNCGVGITLQMCNRVTNHGDMGTFSKPDLVLNCAPTLFANK